MQFKDLCYVFLMVTMAATCIQARNEIREEKEKEKPVDKRLSRRIATLVFDDTTSIARVFQQPKVIYRKLSKKSYGPPKPTSGPRRTKYGPPRTLKKPGKKYRSKNSSKHVPYPYPYKKRMTNPRYGHPKRATSKPAYGPPKKNVRIYNGIGFGEPPSNYNKYQPPIPTEFTWTNKPESIPELTSKPHDVEFSSSATFGDNFSNKPFIDDFWSNQQFDLGKSGSNSGYGEPPVDSYGAPIKPNLHDLTFSTAHSYPESSSHLDEDRNFGPESRPWKSSKEEPDNNIQYSKKHPIFTKPQDIDDIFVTPVPEHQNQELNLNSYSDIYNYRQEEKAKQDKKKRKVFHQKNIKMLNQPWVGGAKMKGGPTEEVIVGGQYAEPPARYIKKFESGLLFDGPDVFTSNLMDTDENDMAGHISSYVNYKNSNMAFSPQNLNDAFSIVE